MKINNSIKLMLLVFGALLTQGKAQGVLLTVNQEFDFSSPINASNYIAGFGLAKGVFVYDINSGGGVNGDENYYRFSLVNFSFIGGVVNGQKVETGDPAYDIFQNLNTLNGTTDLTPPSNLVFADYANGAIPSSIPEPATYGIIFGLILLPFVYFKRR